METELAKHPEMKAPEKWIGVGGTFTTLAAMVKGIPWTERTYMHGTTLTRGEVQAWADRLADMPMEERLRLPGLQPSAMERLGWEQVTVSEYGNLDGYLKRKYQLQGEIRG